MEGCDNEVIDCDETNFLMEGSRRKEPRRGSESMVDEMLFKSCRRNYWKEVKYLSSFGMNKSACQTATTNGDKTNLLHGVQDSILVGSREQGGGISSLKKKHILFLTWFKVKSLHKPRYHKQGQES